MGGVRCKGKAPYTTFQGIQKTYISDCEAWETKPLGKTKLRSNLQRLVDLGIVEMGREGNGRTGGIGGGYTFHDVAVEFRVGESKLPGPKGPGVTFAGLEVYVFGGP